MVDVVVVVVAVDVEASVNIPPPTFDDEFVDFAVVADDTDNHSDRHVEQVLDSRDVASLDAGLADNRDAEAMD